MNIKLKVSGFDAGRFKPAGINSKHDIDNNDN